MQNKEIQKLAEQVGKLCARCEYLHSENNTLRRENQQLRNRCDKAKKELKKLLTALPDYE